MRSPNPRLLCPFNHSFSYLWQEAYDQNTLNLFQKRYNLHHGITFIYRYHGFCDRVNFAIGQEIPFPGSFYFSIFKQLNDFYKSFLIKAEDLFKGAEALKIMYPNDKLDNHLTFHMLNVQNKTYKFNLQGGKKTYLTFVELFCINMLGLGESEESIGEILHIPSQRVTDYIFQAKQRTGMSKEKLILQTFMNQNNQEYIDAYVKSVN